jgi:hypothetical protein
MWQEWTDIYIYICLIMAHKYIWIQHTFSKLFAPAIYPNVATVLSTFSHITSIKMAPLILLIEYSTYNTFDMFSYKMPKTWTRKAQGMQLQHNTACITVMSLVVLAVSVFNLAFGWYLQGISKVSRILLSIKKCAHSLQWY